MDDEVEAPTTLGPYRLMEPLGRGGMGVVYRGIHRDTEQAAAVKTVQLPERRRMDCIRREIFALQRVQHPGVVQILDSGIDGGNPWYAMRLMEGQTLRDYYRELWKVSFDAETFAATPAEAPTADFPSGPWASATGDTPELEIISQLIPAVANGRLPELFKILIRVCHTLAFVHGVGLVHGDLKPENIFLQRDGTPVLVDFGLATQFGARRSREVLVPAGFRAGTYAYMSPEQIRGELSDARTDLYALGVLLYEGVTGRLPFTRGSLLVMHQHLTANPTPPSRLVRDLHPALDRLILDLMAKAPTDRPGHADDVAAQLNSFNLAPAEPPSELRPRPYLYRAGFAGREGQLRQTLNTIPASQPTGAMILIGGESGVGKTRFALELARRLDLPRIEVVTGECFPIGGAEADDNARGAALHPLRSFFVAVSDRCWERGAEETDILLGVRGRRLARFAPLLERVPGIERYPAPTPVSDDVARLQVINDVRATLRAFAQGGALAIILDDLQWADDLTMEILASLDAEWLRTSGVLVIGTWRVEEISDRIKTLLALPDILDVRLGRLGEEAVREIAADMLGTRTPPAPFVSFLTQHSEGNPFFVAEYLRTAVSERVVTRDLQGRWQLATDSFSALSLPGGIQELVARRLNNLAPRAQRLLQIAAVCGRDADADLLARISSFNDNDLLGALDTLRANHVLEESETGRFRFVHDKIREGAYAQIPPELRSRLHRDAAEAMEELYSGERLHFFLPLLVHHWRIADVPHRLASALELAAEAALRSTAYSDALRFFAEALDLPAGLSRADDRRRARWARRAGRAAFSLGDLDRAERYSSLALNLLGYEVPTSAAGWGLFLARHASSHALHATGIARLEQPALSAEARDDMQEAALAAALLAERFYFQNNAPALFAMATLSVNLGEASSFHEREGTPFAWLGYALGAMRLNGLALRYFERAYESCRAAHDNHALAFCKVLTAVHHIGGARYTDATRVLDDARNVVDAENDPQTVELLNTCAGHVDFYTGRFHASMERFAAVTVSARKRANTQHESWGLFSMGRAHAQLGDFERALKDLMDGLELIRALGDPASELITQGLLALTNLRLNDLHEARCWADRTYQQMISSSPTAFSTLDGYLGAAEVYLHLLRNGDRGLNERVQRCVTSLRTLSFMFPLARPAALLYRGQVLLVTGNTSRGRALLRDTIQVAEELSMPFEAATARVALARSLPRREAERDRLLGEAFRTFATLGCLYHIRQLEQASAL